MIVDTLKTIATQTLDMAFQYGDKPSINLHNGSSAIDDLKYCFWLMPVTTKPTFNEFNKKIANEHTIALFICIKSEFDAGDGNIDGMDYFKEKWEKNIKPLYNDGTLDTFTNSFTCLDKLTLSNMEITEVINITEFDYNMDGLYITLNIKEDLI